MNEESNKKNNKLKPVYQILIIILTIALQYTAMQYVSVFGAKPNLPLVLTVVIALLVSTESAALSGLFLGLYHDASSGKILGMYALIYLYVGVIAGFFSKKDSMKSLPATIIITYILSAVAEGSLYLFGYAIPLLRGGYQPTAGLIFALSRIIIPASFLNAVLAVPYYFLFKPAKEKERETSAHVV